MAIEDGLTRTIPVGIVVVKIKDSNSSITHVSGHSCMEKLKGEIAKLAGEISQNIMNIIE